MMKEQDNRCAICNTTFVEAKDACLDHDHDTGLIRSVLCRNCNGIEGKVDNLLNRGKRHVSKLDYIKKLIGYWVHHAVDRTGLYHPTFKTDDEKRLRRNAKARERRARLKAAGE